jgi:hypothetical protein
MLSTMALNWKPERLMELDRLMAFCHLKTRKALFDNAIMLLEWAVQEVRAGNEIASYNRSSDHVEAVRFPVLDNAARRAKARPVELVSTAAAALEPEPERKRATAHRCLRWLLEPACV